MLRVRCTIMATNERCGDDGEMRTTAMRRLRLNSSYWECLEFRDQWPIDRIYLIVGASLGRCNERCGYN